MADDNLTAALGYIRDRLTERDALVERAKSSAVPVIEFKASQDHLAEAVPRLLAAVDAILARHKPGRYALLGALCPEHDAYRKFSITSDEADRVASCPRCPATVARTCDGCLGQWPCAYVRAVSRALIGEDRASA